MLWSLAGLHVIQGLIQFLCVFTILSSGKLNLKREKTKRFYTMSFELFAVFSLIASVLLATTQGYGILAVYFILTYTKQIIFLFLLFKNQAYKYIVYLSLLYSILVSIFTQSFLYLINQTLTMENLSSRALNAGVEVVFGCIFLLLLLLIHKKRKLSSFCTRLLLLPGRLYAVVTATLLFAALWENIVCNEDLTDPGMASLLGGFSIIILNMLIILVISLFLIYHSKNYYENLSEMLSQQVKMQIQHYTDLKENEEIVMAFRHDYKNLITCLRSLLEINNVSEALEYIDEMDLCTAPRKRLIDSGNYIADALITEKTQRAASFTTTILFDGFIPSARLDNVDMCIILANALDNAIEACSKIEGQKEITITSEVINGLWLLSIHNPTKHQVIIRKNQITTTKLDAAFHGFGLYNIHKVTKKNHGTVQLNCKDHLFSLDVSLPLKPITGAV